MSEPPQGWVWSRLGEISTHPQYGWTTRAADSGSVHLLRTTDITKGPIRWETVPFCSELPADADRYLVVDGDILISRAGSVGASALLDNPPAAVFASYLIRFQIDEVIDSRYVAYYLQSSSYWDFIGRSSAGIALQNVNARKLAELPLPIPPQREQHRIVEAIEAAFSKLDAGVAYLSAARKRLELLIEAATWTSLVCSANSSFEPNGHPVIPAHWSWSSLGLLAEVTGGVTKDAKKQTEPGFIEVPYLRVANVQRGWLDLDEVTTIRVSPDRAKALRLEPGDVLFNEGGDRDKLGRGWVWEGQIENCIHQNHVFRARLHAPGFQPKYLSLWGNTFGRRWFDRGGKQTTNLASISMSTLKQFPVPVPPADEQAAIVARIEAQHSILSSEFSAVRVGLRRAEVLRRSILATAFAGLLVPQDASDEPASALLERIAAKRAANAPPTRMRRGRAMTTGAAQ